MRTLASIVTWAGSFGPVDGEIEPLRAGPGRTAPGDVDRTHRVGERAGLGVGQFEFDRPGLGRRGVLGKILDQGFADAAFDPLSLGRRNRLAGRSLAAARRRSGS